MKTRLNNDLPPGFYSHEALQWARLKDLLAELVLAAEQRRDSLSIERYLSDYQHNFLIKEGYLIDSSEKGSSGKPIHKIYWK